MKRLLVVLLFVSISGCAWFQPKAPSTRFGEAYTKAMLSEYDLAMEVKKFLLGMALIHDPSKKHINDIGGRFFRQYEETVDALADFRMGRVDLYILESALDDLDGDKRELSTTIRAYLNILLEGDK